MSEPQATPATTGNTVMTKAPEGVTPKVEATQTATTTTTAPKIDIPANWKDALDESIRGEPSLGLINDVNALAKSYVHAQKNFGANKVVVPNENSSEQDWSEFHKKIGVPQDVNGYELKVSNKEIIPDETLNTFKELVHKSGVLPKQAQKIVDWFTETQTAQMTQMQEKAKADVEAGIKGLEKEWGQGFNRMLSYAQQAAREAGGEDLISYLDQTHLGNDPVILKAFAELGKKMFKEDSPKGETFSNMGQPTPGEAQSELNSLYGQPKDGPLWNKMHPKHKETVERSVYLQQCIYGTE
jgi:hypothetical protein